MLARAEWNDPAIFEGLMCDTEDRVVCATSANLFVLVGGRWLTPGRRALRRRRDSAGLGAGQQPGAAEADLSAAEVTHADALFLCNAVRGILPVGSLGLREWAGHEAVATLRRRLAEAQPAFAFEGR